MKRYKHTYCTSLLYILATFFITFLPGMITLDIALSILGYTKMGTLIKVAFFIILILSVTGVLFAILVTALVNCFKDASVYLDESTIEYKDTKLNLDGIKSITLCLPEVKSRFEISPQELSLYISNKEHMVIRRPSVALVAHLKKRCKNAKFEIDELGKRIKEDAIIALCVAGVEFLFVLFAMK